MIIKINEDKEVVEKIRQEIKENDGYCPCALEKTPDTKCMCQDFLKNVTNGYCHCGLYKKVEV